MKDDIRIDINLGFYNLQLLTDDELDGIFDAPMQGIYFLPSRTGMGWFHKAVAKSSALMFLRADTQSSVLVAFGDRFADVLEKQKCLGFLVRTQRDH